MSEIGKRLSEAASERDRIEIRDLGRYHRHEVETYLRHEHGSDMTPGEREFAKRELRDLGLEID